MLILATKIHQHTYACTRNRMRNTLCYFGRIQIKFRFDASTMSAYMKNTFFCLLFSLLLQPALAQQKPNIIFILTDDLGYGDVGVFFQNQRQKSGDKAQPFHITPSLDKMAAGGAKLTQMYCNAPVCAPSRASLLTGMNQGNAHIRDNQFDKALEDNLTIASVLKQAGYATAAIGKWGLQGTNNKLKPNWPAHPLKRGFDHFYGYMRHADGHEHYPFEGLYREKKEVYDDYKEVSAGLAGCYTADLWTASAKKYITENVQSKGAKKPFFVYLAYDTPHAVLELPAAPYPAGRGLKGGMQWTGKKGNMISTASGKPDSYTYPEYAAGVYDDDHNTATPDKPWPDTYKRYASAVRRIDDGIGDIMQLLKDLHIEDNTLVVFSSDNGPSIESYLPQNYEPYKPTFFGSYGPFDGIKRDVWEGGVRMPVLARWLGHIPAGKTVDTPYMLSDWLATFADAAHIPAPARTDGVSLLPALTGRGKQQESQVYIEYFQDGKTPSFREFEASRRGRQRGQMQMLRQGNMVGVRYNIRSADDDFELYDVVKDPKQTTNLALHGGLPALQAAMKAKASQMHRADTGAARPYDTALIAAVKTNKALRAGLEYAFYPSDAPWPISGQAILQGKKGIVKAISSQPSGGRKGTIHYSAFIRIPADGAYTFSLNTFAQSIIRLHQVLLFDAGFADKYPLQQTVKVYLKAGLHPLNIYTMSGSEAKNKTFSFSWKDSSGKIYNQLIY